MRRGDYTMIGRSRQSLGARDRSRTSTCQFSDRLASNSLTKVVSDFPFRDSPARLPLYVVIDVRPLKSRLILKLNVPSVATVPSSIGEAWPFKPFIVPVRLLPSCFSLSQKSTELPPNSTLHFHVPVMSSAPAA